MKRREFITLLVGAAVAWPLAARAQQPGKVYRIGMLETISEALNAANLAAFRKSLSDLGYIEGHNLFTSSSNIARPTVAPSASQRRRPSWSIRTSI
jgi:hypothetical protein